MDNQIAAVHRLKQATESYAQKGTESITALSSMATAHAVLALIDIITGDRETEIQDANQRIAELEERLEAERADYASMQRALDDRHRRIRELEAQLDGCNDTVRRRDLAETNSKKQQET